MLHPQAADNRGDNVIVAETVQSFITLMDALKLGQKAVDEIQVFMCISRSKSSFRLTGALVLF